MTTALEPIESTQLVEQWRRRRIWGSLRKSLGRGRNLGWFALTIPMAALGVAAGSFALGLGGGLVVSLVGAAMVAKDVVDATSPPVNEPARIEASGVLRDGVLPEDIRSPQLRASYIAILEAHERLAAVVGRDRLTPGLQDIVDGTDELVMEAGRLAVGANDLHGYLMQIDDTRTKARALRLEKHAEMTEDSAACTTFLRAAALTHRNDEIHGEMRAAFDLIYARLSAIESLLQCMAARIVRLRTTMPDGFGLVEAGAADPTELLDLGALERDMALMERSVSEATMTSSSCPARLLGATTDTTSSTPTTGTIDEHRLYAEHTSSLPS